MTLFSFPGVSRRKEPGWLITALILSALFLGALGPQQARAASNLNYYPQTGHYLSGNFKTYWEQNGGLEQFGYPLTEVFVETSPTDGKSYQTQYFERAVFEYHPEFAGTQYQVLLRLAGNLTTQGRSFGPSPVTSSGPDLYYFPQTQHSLQGRFLDYWIKWGGLPVYGYPTSEPFTELNPADNKTYTVQYFERARFEYHPEFDGTRYEVELGLLGWQLLNKASVPDNVKAKQPAGLSTAPFFPAAPTTVPLTITPLQGPHIGYGMNVWLFGQDKDRVLNLVSGAGFGWIRQQVGWDSIEPAPRQYQWTELDAIVDAAARHNIKVILSVVRSPGWAGINGTSGLPANPDDFGRLLTNMALRYKGRVTGYEVWNEQNIERETGGGKVLVAPYVATLKAGYTAVKAVDPGAVVLFGGLSPTGINDPNYAIDDVKFLEQAYQYNNGEIKNYFDVLGAHPGGAANSPDEYWPSDPPADKNRPWSTDGSFYFRRVEALRAVMEKYGDGSKQMWLTEFGWTTKNAAPGYEYGALVSDQMQADYLVRAYQRAKADYPWMGVMAMWQLNFATVVGANDEKAPWGLINADWSLRPSYTALKNMPK
ncbi:MAG: cellulase family glycosylhydrolase [Chloroflexi bacterium]|nr:cellulase family glycosylhydrolase [Chloroflexota bacterium]